MTLEQIRGESDVSSVKKLDGSGLNWRWIILAILAIGATLFFFLRPEKNEQPKTILNTEPEDIKSYNPPVEVKPPTKELQEPAIVPEKTEEAKEETLPPNIKKSPPIAANFDVNPLLESEMREGLRGVEIEVQLNQPANNTRFVEGASILFSGQLETDYALDELDLRLLIFTNKVADYQNFEPIEEKAILFKDDFSFELNAIQSLSQGLYYFIIEDLNEETFLKVGKFEIR